MAKKRKLKGEMLKHCSRRRLESKAREEESIREGEEGLKETLELTENEIKNQDSVYELPGIPLAPSNQNVKPGIIFVLEKASLVLAFVGRRYQILNPDEHADFLRKKNLDPYHYRPDIVHEALLQIMGSRLCMAGRVQAVYIKTDEGVLIKVEPHANIPKTLGRFCAMMCWSSSYNGMKLLVFSLLVFYVTFVYVFFFFLIFSSSIYFTIIAAELLQKFSIKAKGKREKLLHLVQNPVTQHLPVNSLKIGLSFSSNKVVQLRDKVSAISDDVNLVFVVGAMAHGKIDSEYIDDLISVSGYPLSAGVCLRRICIALERKWNIG